MSLTIKEILERTKPITEHYVKTRGKWSQPEQIAHIHAEVSEVWDVLRNKNKKYGSGQTLVNNFLEENSDIILATVTLLHLAGTDAEEFEKALEKTICKIEKRVENEKV